MKQYSIEVVERVDLSEDWIRESEQKHRAQADWYGRINGRASVHLTNTNGKCTILICDYGHELTIEQVKLYMHELSRCIHKELSVYHGIQRSTNV